MACLRTPIVTPAHFSCQQSGLRGSIRILPILATAATCLPAVALSDALVAAQPAYERYDNSEMKLAFSFALVVLGVQAQTIDARLDALVAPYRENDAPGMVERDDPVDD